MHRNLNLGVYSRMSGVSKKVCTQLKVVKTIRYPGKKTRAMHSLHQAVKAVPCIFHKTIYLKVTREIFKVVFTL